MRVHVLKPINFELFRGLKDLLIHLFILIFFVSKELLLMKMALLMDSHQYLFHFCLLSSLVSLWNLECWNFISKCQGPSFQNIVSLILLKSLLFSILNQIHFLFNSNLCCRLSGIIIQLILNKMFSFQILYLSLSLLL